MSRLSLKRHDNAKISRAQFLRVVKKQEAYRKKTGRKV
jgi:hypothetical protein